MSLEGGGRHFVSLSSHQPENVYSEGSQEKEGDIGGIGGCKGVVGCGGVGKRRG